MSKKTESEAIFEKFCQLNGIFCSPIPTSGLPTPDYELLIEGRKINVEVKQIDEDGSFSPEGGSRTVGAHVRAKVNDARHQAKQSLLTGAPFILMIFNNLDSEFQLFGTECHDFSAGMYGDITLDIPRGGGQSNSYYGRNAAIREDKNPSFSGIGHLATMRGTTTVEIYVNAYATVPIPSLPSCFVVNNVAINQGSA